MDLLARMSEIKIVPVVVVKEEKDALPIIDGLVIGGIPVAEVTFRTECAGRAIKIMLDKYPDAIVGAGTVLNAKQCEEALSVGAKFIVSPCFSEEVFQVCKKHNALYIPGVITPTEVLNAYNHGLTYLKFFPAGEFGGLKTIKALSAVFPMVKFMPTGGVNLENLKEFLNFKNIYAVGGTYIAKGSKEEIIANCKASLKIKEEN